MVSALDSASSVVNLAGKCVVFLGKTLYSRYASVHPGVQMSTSEFYAGAGVPLRWTSIPSKGGVEILLVA